MSDALKQLEDVETVHLVDELMRRQDVCVVTYVERSNQKGYPSVRLFIRGVPRTACELVDMTRLLGQAELERRKKGQSS